MVERNIVVCIKQVPDSQKVTIDPIKKTLNRAEAGALVNPPDENALELGLRMREMHGGKVMVITMGPSMASQALQMLIAMGADDAILITDRAFAGADTYPTSLTLSAVIQKIPDVWLIICGEETTDSSTGHIGPGIAEHLGLPQATFISDLSYKGGKFIAKRVIDGGTEEITSPPPAVVSVTLNMNKPRLPTLHGKLRAKRYKMNVWNAEIVALPTEWLGLKGSPTRVVKIESEVSAVERNVKFVDAKTLIKKLREGGLINV